MVGNSSPHASPDGLRAVAALAVLKVNWDERRDYIANFTPLIAHCVRESGAAAVSVPEIQDRVWETFGLRIPQGPLKTIVHRASRDGLMDREHNVYRPNTQALQDLSLAAVRESVLRQHAHLVERLRDFAERQLGRSWSEEQAERALLAYVEVLAEPILGATVEGKPILDLPRIEAEGSYVVSRFVLDLCKHEPEAFEYLETVVKGSMLANVLYFPEAFSGGRPQLGQIDIYLDTPIVLRVLGYTESYYRAPAVELVELLREQGASLKIFDHTLREVEGVLDAAAAMYRTGRSGDMPGDVVTFFVSEGLSASDVQALIASLEERLERNHVEVVPTPPQTTDLAVDENELENRLNREVGYRRREALLRDLDSLTAIYRFRNGEIRRRIERCDAVLVTTNGSVVRTAKGFFSEIHGGRGVPLCIIDARLAAIAWLMNPVQASDLPRKQIIATSYAALNPPESVWRRYLQEIKKLVESGELDETQVGLLVFSPEARLELMNATDGKVDAFTEGTVSQILDYAKASAQAEVVAELDREKARREEAEEEIAAEKAKASQAVAQAAAVSAAHRGRLSQVSRQVARLAGIGAFVLVLVAVTVGTGFATAGLFPSSWSSAAPFVSSFLVALALIAGITSIAFDVALKDLVPTVERQLHPRIEKWLRRWFAPAE